jgi:Neuralized
MRDILAFHPTGHGKAVRLVPGRYDLIERNPSEPWCGGGVAFTARPLKPGQKVCLEVHHRHSDEIQLPGSLRLGFTVHDPTAMISSQLPSYLIPDLTDTNGYWARPVGSLVGHGSQITVTLDSTGRCACWDVNGSNQGVLVEGLDGNCPLWMVVDLYGPVNGLRLVPPG